MKLNLFLTIGLCLIFTCCQSQHVESKFIDTARVSIDTLKIDTDANFINDSSKVSGIVYSLKKILKTSFTHTEATALSTLKGHLRCFKEDLAVKEFNNLQVVVYTFFEREHSYLDDDQIAIYELHFDTDESAKTVYEAFDKYNDFFGSFHLYYYWIIIIEDKKILIVESLENTLNHKLQLEILLNLKVENPRLRYKVRI